MNQSNDKLVFYEKVQPKYVVAFTFSIMGLLYFIFTLKFVVSIPVALALFAVFMMITAFLFIISALMIARALCRPMLTLDSHTLTFRGINIPWTMISAPTSIRTKGGERLGIALDQPAQEYIANLLAPKPSSQRVFLWFMRHYGALPVAPARDADLGHLRTVVERYRAG
jgi:uncharacterized membrane protein YcgQ (UPF0703/DUF1980 family)